MKRGLAVSSILLAGLSARAWSQASAPPPVKKASPASTSPASDSIIKRAVEAREQGHTEDAATLYERALRLNASSREGWWALGTIRYEQDRYTEGRDAFRRLTALDPATPVGWAMLGLCEFQTHDYPQALAHLEHAETLGMTGGEQIADVTRYHLALLLTRNEQYEDAAAILSRFAKLGRQEPQFVEAFGIAALRKPLLPAEVPATERELVMDTGRAVYDATTRRVAEADAEFKSLIANHPQQSNLHFLYGSFLLQNDPERGLAEMQTELTITPTHLPSLVSIAAEYLRQKDYKTGLPFGEKAVASAPESFAAHAILGRLLCEGDLDPTRGTKELESAVKLAPGSPQSRFALATAYAKAGRKTDASRERAEFLRLQNLSKEKTGEQ